MENESPKYLNCPWCSAQSYFEGVRVMPFGKDMGAYKCPAHHRFFVRVEDPSFNFGHNKTEREEER